MQPKSWSCSNNGCTTRSHLSQSRPARVDLLDELKVDFISLLFLAFSFCFSLHLLFLKQLSFKMRLFLGLNVAFLASSAIADSTPIWGSDFPVFPLQENAETEKLFPMASCSGFKLEEATIDQMQEAMKKGKLTSQQLVICYLQRQYQTDDYIK